MQYHWLLAPLVGVLFLVAPARAQEVREAPPEPPAGAAANLAIPEHGPDGAYLTPNYAVSPAEAVWHVRSALNVAALGCRSSHEAQTIAAYNALIAGKGTVLAAADAETQARYHARFGATWRGRHDSAMTRVYNFFAQPPAHDRFCAVAERLLDEAQAVPTEGFAEFAKTALVRLEAPFTDFYRRYESYRVALAGWRNMPSAMAISAPVRTDVATAVGHFGPE